MSVYQFAPTFSQTQNHSFVTWENSFSDEELNEIIKVLEAYPKEKAVIEDGVKNDEIRNSKVAWIELNDKTSFLYDRLANIARQVNSKFYNFDLYGFAEHFQYTVYEGADNQHYTWHLDMSNNLLNPRKLTLILQLSDPDEYEGGDIETLISSKPSQVLKQKGLICAFPSWALHRVTPVTKGVRRSLVIWIAGPQFK